MSDSLSPFPVVDAHVHFAPDTAELVAQIMESNHLATVVNLGILWVLGIPFEEGMRQYRRVLGDRMIYFPTPDFSDTAPGFGQRMAEELERKVEAGAGGLKIFKELGLRHRDSDDVLIPIDDPRLDSLWDKAGELGVPVLIHCADPVAFFRPLDENNERREELERHPDWHFAGSEFPDHDELLTQRNRVIERHPGTTFIGAHLGNYPESLTYVDACLDRYPNFNVDVCARIGEIGRHRAEKARAFFVKHQDRVLFGTDLVLGWDALANEAQSDPADFNAFYDAYFRFFDTDQRQIDYPEYPSQGRWQVDAINLPVPVLEKLYCLNARRLIPGM